MIGRCGVRWAWHLQCEEGGHSFMHNSDDIITILRHDVTKDALGAVGALPLVGAGCLQTSQEGFLWRIQMRQNLLQQIGSHDVVSVAVIDIGR